MKCSKCNFDFPESEFRIQSGKRGLARVCLSCDKKDARIYYGKHKDLAKTNANMRFYGLLEEDYQELINRQQGKCAICKCILTDLCVDHDHTTDAIRGLLYNDCNLGLGNFKDSLALLQSAIAYLQAAPQKPALKNLLASMMWRKS